MSEGFRQAGYHVIGAVEIDADASTVYAINHPTTTLWRTDIRSVSASDVLTQLKLRKGELDLMGGCPPCQGFSTLRTRNGGRRIRDGRNDLIFEFQRLVISLAPKHVMLENVPGLATNRRLRVFKEALEKAGYAVSFDVLNVRDYGVPQRRRRLVVLASRESPVRFARPVRRERTVRDAIGSLPTAGTSGDAIHDLPVTYSPRIARLIRYIPRDGGSRASLPKHLRLRCHGGFRGFHDVYGRMAWDEPAPTITTGCFNPSKGRFLHPSAHRAITMREAALLQSFPKSYKFPADLGKVKIAALIGNALPPQFIKRLALNSLRRAKEG